MSTTTQTSEANTFNPTLIWDEEFAERWDKMMGRHNPDPAPTPPPIKRKPRRPSPTK